MGTINFGGNNYVNLGMLGYNSWDLEQDTEVMAELQEMAMDAGIDFDLYIENYLQDCNDWEVKAIEDILWKYDFEHWNIAIEPGYYDGFYLTIENNLPWEFDDFDEKATARKELLQVKKALMECVEQGMNNYSRGWCCGFANYEDTCKAVADGVKKMCKEFAEVPVYLGWGCRYC